MDISKESDHQLRRRLDEIANSLPLDVHPARIAELRLTHPHTIEIGSDPEVVDVPPGKLTCIMHAFGLAHSMAVEKITCTFEHTYPSSEFVVFLVDHYLSELRRTRTRDGGVVVYLNGYTIPHVGKMRAERVVSKWGRGLLWEHGIAEVPAQYGNTVRFYRAIDRATAEAVFVAYAKQREGVEVIDQLLGT